MPRFVSLSRAAKLVGISRSALQKKVHDHELESFEGQVHLNDIERIFPDAQLEDNHIIEDLEKIVEQALQRARGEKLAQLLSPDTHTLAARLQVITKENAHSKEQVLQLHEIIKHTQSKITELSNTPDNADLFSELNDWIATSLETMQQSPSKPIPITERDTLLRVIAAQVHIINTQHEYFIEGNNSILEGGLSAGLALNYGCSNGNCGKCKARLISGDIKKIKPHDFVFSETEKRENYFLSCSNTAVTDIQIEADEAGSEVDIPQQHITAKVKKVEKPTDDIIILNLKTPRTQRMRFIAGQNAVLNIGGLPSIEIPIASCPCDDMNIQFHLAINKEVPSKYDLYKTLTTSTTIDIKGPSGSFVIDEDSNNSVIFIAFDTGFAPIKSLIEHAVTLENADFIRLYWLHNDTQPYMHNQCRAWEDALDNFTYQHQQYDINNTSQLKENLKILSDELSELNDKSFFICGSESVLDITQSFLLEHGVDKTQLKTQKL